MAIANLKTKRVWDFLWSRLSIVASGPGVVSPFGVRSVVIDEPLTLYVATTGSDSAPGTQTDPFATIQAAIDYLKDFIIAAPVTISVGAGTFAGFDCDGLTFTSGVVLSSAQTGGYLVIQGSTTTLYTGTVTSTAATDTVKQVVTDAGATFVVDEHIGRILYNSSVSVAFSPYRVCVTNAAGTITFGGGNWGANSTSYQILQLDTKINCTSGRANAVVMGGHVNDMMARGSSPASANTPPNQYRTTLRFLEISSNGITSSCPLSSAFARFNAQACRFLVDSASTSAQLVNLTRSWCHFDACLMQSAVSTAASPMNWGGSALGGGDITVVGCYLRKITTLNGIWFNAIPGPLRIANTVMEGGDLAVSLLATSNISTLQCWIINITTGIQLGAATSGFAGPAWVTNFTGRIEGATTGILVMDGSSLGMVSGNIGATTAISCLRGGRCKVAAAVTFTGSTTELSVDAVTATAATMRAASPKTFPTTANIYGSLVYE